MEKAKEGEEPRRGVRVRLAAAGEAELGGYAYVPERAGPDVPLLVAVHGISRDAREQARAFQAAAEAHGWVLVAPEFLETRHGDYQRLGRVGRGPRADRALEDLIDACAKRFDLRFGRRFLFGFSAGGQFVHRYLMAHPQRVTAAVVGAPGWYTFPDPRRAYPHGMRVGRELPGVRMVPTEFLKTPVLVVVGSRDFQRDRSLRQTAGVDRQQGQDRLERAVRWVEAMNRLALGHELPQPVQLQVIKGAGHDFTASCVAGLVGTTESFLTAQPLEPAGPRPRLREESDSRAADRPKRENDGPSSPGGD